MKKRIFGKSMPLITIGFMIILSTSIAVSAKEIFVDVNHGKDTNSGTLLEPFQTLKKAAGVMASGDICYIREGVYRETVIPKADRLTFRNFENEYVLITGLDVVEKWTPWDRGVWKARFVRIVPEPFKTSMVFVDGMRMNWTRYPNEDGDMLNNRDMIQVDVGVDASTGPGYLGTVVFDDLPSSAKNACEGAYFVGVASYNIGAWFTANKDLVQESEGDSLVMR